MDFVISVVNVVCDNTLGKTIVFPLDAAQALEERLWLYNKQQWVAQTHSYLYAVLFLWGGSLWLGG